MLIRLTVSLNQRCFTSVSCAQRSVDKVLERLNDEKNPDKRRSTYTRLLRWCGGAHLSEEGKRVHDHIKRNNFVGMENLLIGMYGKCARLAEAREVFERIDDKTVLSWSEMIAAYARNGHYGEAVNLYKRLVAKGGGADKYLFTLMISAHINNKHPEEALSLFWRMHLEGVQPDSYAVGLALKACAQTGALLDGRAIHESISGTEIEAHLIVSNCLITMYGKCGQAESARKVFEAMRVKDVVSWNALVVSYAQGRSTTEVFQVFQQMQLEGIKPDGFTFIGLLESCVEIGHGRVVHEHVEANGLSSELGVGNSLLGMYARCRSVVEARNVFDGITCRNSVSWAAMSTTYTQLGYPTEAFHLARVMNLEGVRPNRASLLGLVAACAQLEDLNNARLVHTMIASTGFSTDLAVETSMVNMYGKCGSLHAARALLDGMKVKSVVSWNAMISAYAQHNRGQDAIELLSRMDLEGTKPSKVTFVSMMDALAGLGDETEAEHLHSRVVQTGFGSDVNVNNTVVSMYGKFGRLEEARRVFDEMENRDTVSWNALLVEYSQHGYVNETVDLFRRMDLDGVKQDKISYTALLNVSFGQPGFAKAMHKRAVSSGLFEPERCERNNNSVANFLINLYAESGTLEDAKDVFQGMKRKDLVSWNAMLTAYVRHKLYKHAFTLFRNMELEGVKPDHITFVLLLDACSAAAVAPRLLHARVVAQGMDSDDLVRNAAVNMYAQCGDVEAATREFDRMTRKDVISWTVMVAALAQHGRSKPSLKLFWRMQQDGTKPDHISFLCALFSCSHSGLVKDAVTCFSSMVQDHGMQPQAEHRACVIDMLGKAGWLDEAEELAAKMKSSSEDMVSARALLAACKLHGDTGRGVRAADRLDTSKVDHRLCVLLSNLHACSS